jgi:hypothetical protein
MGSMPAYDPARALIATLVWLLVGAIPIALGAGAVRANGLDECKAPGPVGKTAAGADAPDLVWDDVSIARSRRTWAAVAAAPSSARPAVPAQRVLVSAPRDASLWIVPDEDSPSGHRIATRAGMLTTIRPSPDGRDAYYATCDGWIGRVDLERLAPLVVVRGALRLADFAVSSDGRHVAVASLEPPALLVFDRDLVLTRRLAGRDASGKREAPVTVVADAAARRSFVATLPAIGELWEVSYDPTAEDIPAGVIHDFLFREGAFVRGYLNPRRTRLGSPPDGARVDTAMHEVAVATSGVHSLDVVHLDVRRRIATVPLNAAPLIARAASWLDGKHRLLVMPLQGSGIALLDADRGRLIAHVATPGEVATLAAHDRSGRLWLTYAGDAEHRAVVQPLDLGRRALGAAWRPAPHGDIQAVLYAPAGDRVFVAAGLADGSIAAFDAVTLQQRWRIAVRWPAALQVAPLSASNVSR